MWCRRSPRAREVEFAGGVKTSRIGAGFTALDKEPTVVQGALPSNAEPMLVPYPPDAAVSAYDADEVDGDAYSLQPEPGPPQQLDHEVLLALRRRCSALRLGD